MPVTLTIRDETPGGTSFREWSLEVLTERLTVRELIRSRVYQEVQDYNQRQPAEFQGLIQPTDAERTLNGYRLKKARQIDWREQFAKAIVAFEANQVLVLINPLVYVSEGMRGMLTPSLPHMSPPVVAGALVVLSSLFLALGLRAFDRRAVT